MSESQQTVFGGFGTAWVECKLRKDHSCQFCRKILSKGQRAFRPLGEPDGWRMMRYDRVCRSCVEDCKGVFTRK